VLISKRQVVRLLAAKLETFRTEDEQVLNAGLSSAAYVTVTGARHVGQERLYDVGRRICGRPFVWTL
jgi:hypothetical protein